MKRANRALGPGLARLYYYIFLLLVDEVELHYFYCYGKLLLILSSFVRIAINVHNHR